MAAPQPSPTNWLEGRLIEPGDQDYDDARAVWNGVFDRFPAAIARVAGTADVVRAIEFAHKAGLPVSVRGGSYNVAGTSVVDGGLVIDLSGMTRIRVDAAARRARVQPGVRSGELLRALEAHGLVTPVGRVSQVGVAGLTLGGGIGSLMGTHGLTIDNVVSFEVVTADGRLLRAAADENEDLYWALRGGGGNFGVVTEFEFHLHEQGTMLAGRVVYPAADAADVLGFFRRFSLTVPDELTVSAGLLHTPDGQPVVVMVPVYSGDDLAEGERLLRPLRGFGRPVADTVGPMRYSEFSSMMDRSGPPGRRYHWRSGFLPDLDDDVIEVLAAGFGQVPSPHTMILIDYLHGAATRVAPTATAFPHRDPSFHVIVSSGWEDPAADGRNIGWTDDVWTPLSTRSTGVYVNSLGSDGDRSIHDAYGPNHDRLAEIKSTYDPANFFHMNQNIEPQPHGRSKGA
ncbi:FAD-binding oxidoreductase [Streptomyces sp. WMMC500]|uniref:FAD-binding oxidoreductase n=1 Tax=Streptomyces sp. WMMC500 TaxID=3015154 RepID=UPI00248C2936|nr:FAD-binding oxidoreductase [Streptomyces sp. WMMC500]WBB57785.1 FAD-binding oxidoreductase [Streptomyces sp. WMMC500]